MKIRDVPQGALVKYQGKTWKCNNQVDTKGQYTGKCYLAGDEDQFEVHPDTEVDSLAHYMEWD